MDFWMLTLRMQMILMFLLGLLLFLLYFFYGCGVRIPVLILKDMLLVNLSLHTRTDTQS